MPTLDGDVGQTRPRKTLAPAQARRPSLNVLWAGGDWFVGRERESDQIVQSVLDPSVGIVSITGLSGSGKSALASHVALTVSERDGFEVAWLDMATGLATGSLGTTIAQALGAEVFDPRMLGVALSDRRVLLVLDGADTAAAEMDEVLHGLPRVPNLTMLTTSIRPLASPVGLLIALGGLDVPPPEWDPEQDPTPYAAVDLFVTVANESAVGPKDDRGTKLEVGRICRQLGGLPLAVMLAAARFAQPLGSAGKLSRHIQRDPALGLLLGPSGRAARGRPQRTVGEALAWTWELLDREQRFAFNRLGLLCGPFGLAAAAGVCGLSQLATLGTVEDLVGLRLIEPVESSTGEQLYTMSPLVRSFARDALIQDGDRNRAAALHASFFAGVLRQESRRFDNCEAALDLLSPTQFEGDLFQALDYLTDQGRADAALRMAADMGHLAYYTSLGPQLLRRLESLIPLASAEGPADTVADGLLWAATLHFRSRDAADTVHLALRHWRRGIELARQGDNPNGVLRGLAQAILALPLTRDFALASVCATEGLELADQTGHVRWLARFTAWSGMIAHQQGDFTRAAELASLGLQRALRTGDWTALSSVGLLVAGMPHEHAPDLPLLPSLEDLLAHAMDLGDRELQSKILVHLAGRAVQRGDGVAAAKWILQRLPLVAGSGDWYGVSQSLLCSIRVLCLGGEYRLAARTYGALAPMMDALSEGMSIRTRTVFEDVVSEMRRRLGASEFNTEVRTGSGVSWDDALTAILPSLLRVSKSRVRPSSGGRRGGKPARLTARETEVLELLGKGMTNKAIAEALGISPKTVTHHTVAIYQKLGVQGRAEATILALRSDATSV